MTVARSELEATLDRILQPERFQDYAPNGLQVEGRDEVSLLVTGVTASQALIDAAIAAGADAILVHHGFFWKGESPVLRGMKRRRIAALLAADISLFAYHLPLDAHPEHGNNAALARLLSIHPEGPLRPGDPVGNVGTLVPPQPVSVLLENITARLDRVPLHVGNPQREVQRIAWCTGAAQSYIEAAVAADVDAYLTGEVSEQTVHVAREEGIEFIAAGHHATERYGVQALGETLAQQLDLEHRFIDIDNPV